MRKILLILPNNLGDVIMTLPVIENLKKKYPDCLISFFVENGFEGGLINFKYCDNIIKFDRKSIHDLIKSDWIEGIKVIENTVEKIKKENYEQIINLSQITYISFLMSILKGKNCIGQSFLKEGNHSINNRWTSYLYAIPFARKYNCLHATDIYKRIAGVERLNKNSGICISLNEKEAVSKYLKSKKTEIKKNIAVLHPGAAYDSKRWPLENFIELGKKIVENEFTIIISGAESERDFAHYIQTQIGHDCIVTSGELSFRESIVLLSFAEFCVTSDTAVMHAAASMSKKVFALFGPTSPVETGPYSSNSIIFCGRCEKRPCFCSKCENKKCMKSISPETVYSFVKNNPDLNTTCDIYKTSFVDGVYKIMPVVEKGNPYYYETGASVTRKSLDNHIVIDTENIQYKEILNSSINFMRITAEMKRHLIAFLNSGAKVHIQRFESSRALLINEKGINEFWAALLNLDLNSIPLLDPISGIKESISACEKISQQIKNAISL